jgi:hypothetical protein
MSELYTLFSAPSYRREIAMYVTVQCGSTHVGNWLHMGRVPDSDSLQENIVYSNAGPIVAGRDVGEVRMGFKKHVFRL